VIAVRLDSANFRSGKNNDLRFLLGEKSPDRSFVREVEVRPISLRQVREPLCLQPPNERPADQATVTGYKNLIRPVHDEFAQMRFSIFFFPSLRNPSLREQSPIAPSSSENL